MHYWYYFNENYADLSASNLKPPKRICNWRFFRKRSENELNVNVCMVHCCCMVLSVMRLIQLDCYCGSSPSIYSLSCNNPFLSPSLYFALTDKNHFYPPSNSTIYPSYIFSGSEKIFCSIYKFGLFWVIKQDKINLLLSTWFSFVYYRYSIIYNVFGNR